MIERIWDSVFNPFRRTKPAENTEQEWDDENNSPSPLFSISPSGDIDRFDSQGYLTIDSGAEIWSTEATTQILTNIEQSRDYTFSLANGQDIQIRLINNNNSMEIEYNNNIITPQLEDGKITLSGGYDEENNASPNTGTYKESLENNSHGSSNLLQSGSTVFYSQT